MVGEPGSEARRRFVGRLLAQLTRSLATRSYDLMIEPGFGFNPDAKLSVEGFNNVLTLRQEIEGGPVPRPEKYLDLSYYDRALKLVK